jgi:uncharacterized protein
MHFLRITVVSVIGAALALIAVAHASTHWAEVVEVTVKVPGLPPGLDGVKILHLTDWHNRSAVHTEIDVLEVVGDASFDLVCLTGDLVESSADHLGPVKKALARLRERAPLLAVAGNHDWSAGAPLIITQLQDVGVITLENASTEAQIRDASLTVVGVSDFFSRRANVNAAFAGAGDGFTLVLTHDPVIFPQIADRGPSLVLAGHTHGGQIRLPLLPTLYAPGQGFFPRYGDGLYREGDSVMYVSRGIGYTGTLPFRFWNRPEITVLTLSRDD